MVDVALCFFAALDWSYLVMSDELERIIMVGRVKVYYD